MARDTQIAWDSSTQAIEIQASKVIGGVNSKYIHLVFMDAADGVADELTIISTVVGTQVNSQRCASVILAAVNSSLCASASNEWKFLKSGGSLEIWCNDVSLTALDLSSDVDCSQYWMDGEL